MSPEQSAQTLQMLLEVEKMKESQGGKTLDQIIKMGQIEKMIRESDSTYGKVQVDIGNGQTAWVDPGQALSAGVSREGHISTAASAEAGRKVTIRGQDMTAGTAATNQLISVLDKDINNNLAARRENRLSTEGNIKLHQDAADLESLVAASPNDPGVKGYMDSVNESFPERNSIWVQVEVPGAVYGTNIKGYNVQLPKGITAAHVMATARKYGIPTSEVLKQMGKTF